MSDTMKRRIIAVQHLLLIVGMLVASCSKFEYTDQLQNLGKRVEVLEEMELKVNEQLETLHQIVMAVENNGYVTGVKENPDGTLSVTFNTGKEVTLRQGRDGKDGKDGKEAVLDLSVAEGPDGKMYWTLNDRWLTDEDGNLVLAGAIDGKDGKDGVDGKDGADGKDGKSASMAGAVVPQTRINPDTRHWEISTDGGNTWTDTGTVADGADGRNGIDGKNGQNGADDIFMDVKVNADGKSITFILRDGRTFTVPIM